MVKLSSHVSSRRRAGLEGMLSFRRLAAGALFVVLLLLASCDSTNPVAPEEPKTGNGNGNSTGAFEVKIDANPPELIAGDTNPAVLTITVTGKNGAAGPPDGKAVAVSTSLGSFDPGKAVTVQTVTLQGGKATVSLFPGKDVGTATILAQVDTSASEKTIAIKEFVKPAFFLTSILPNSGSAEGGTTVQIQGAGFDDPVRVTFGDVVSPSVRVLSPTLLQATTPHPSAPVAVGEIRAVDVAVTNALDTAEPATDKLPGGFIYSNGGAIEKPVVLTLLPSTGTNDGNFEVEIRGLSLPVPASNAQVIFGFAGAGGLFEGLEADVISASETRLVVEAPAASGLASLRNKQVDILVRNRATGFSTVAPSAFKYTGETIVITGLSPESGSYRGGQEVRITGSGFRSVVDVKLAGINQTVILARPTEIRVTTRPVSIPDCKPLSGVVEVTNLDTGDSGASPLKYTYTIEKPLVSSITATKGPQAGGTTVKIVGTGFDSPMRVEFGGAPSQSVTVKSATEIEAVLPAFTGKFEVEPCDDNKDSQMGERYVNKAVDVKLTQAETACTDLLATAFTYEPTDKSCRNDTAVLAPIANFSSSLVDPSNRLVQFNDLSSGTGITSWAWDFGDGTGSSQRSPLHQFPAPGVYEVSLTVANPKGQSTAKKTITVPAPAP